MALKLAGLLVLAASWTAPAAWGQTARPAPPAPIVDARGAFFALTVPDLEASSRWYADKLGLKTVMTVPKNNGIAVTVLEGGGLVVELIQHDGAAADPCGASDPTMCQGLFKAGVLVHDLDRTLERLAARGVSPAFGPFPADSKQRANAIIRDNAGNLIQLLQK